MARLTLNGAGGAGLFYRELGERGRNNAATALLLHRAGGSSRGWDEVLAALGDERHAVALDLPAHGESPGSALESIPAMADLISECIDALELGDEGRLVLVGHSMGGAIALELALRRPTLARAIVLVNSGATLRVATPILDAIRDQFELIPSIMGKMVFGSETPAEVAERWAGALFDAPGPVVLADMEACDGFDVEPRLSELQIPVDLLVGKEDHLTPPRLGRRLIERTPTASMEVIPGAGHMLPLERADLVAKAIARRLDEARTEND